MRGIRRKEEERALVDGDVLDDGGLGRGGGFGVNSLEEHGAAILVEEFGGGVDVVVCSRVGAADYHHRVAGGAGGGGVVDAVVVDWGAKEVGVGF